MTGDLHRSCMQPVPKSRLQRLVGVEQWRIRHLRNTFAGAMLRPIKAILKPVVFITMIYYLLIFAWVVGELRAVSMLHMLLYR